jgi:hypothetical protein
MKKRYAFVAFFLLVITISCKENSAKYHINSFFKNISWIKFNTETLRKNHLDDAIDDSIDVFHREFFFSFMKDSKYDNSYNEFTFIEIETSGEVYESKKVLIIPLDNKITSLAFKRGIGKWIEFNLSDEEIKNYIHKYAATKFSVSYGQQVMTTKITGNLYK